MISMHLDPSLAIATASDLCHIELESRSRDVPAAGRSGEAIWAASHQRPGAQSRSGTGRAGTGRREPQPPNPKASPIRGEGTHTHLASRAAQQQEPSGRARDRPTTTTIIAAADEKAGGWRRARSSVRQRQSARVGRRDGNG